MGKRFLAISILLGLLATSGCWDMREISASVIASGVGIDLAQGNKIAFTTQLIQSTTSSESGSNKSQPVTVSAVDYSVAMAARRLMLSLSLVPEWAHVKTLLLGKQLASQDLSLCVDFMTRNRNIRPDANLLVCVGNTPEEVLKSQLPEGTNLGSGLKDMLPESESLLGYYVPITMEEFAYRLSTPGIEPAVPQIRLINNSSGLNSSSDGNPSPILQGMAVFKGNKMVGSLNEYESRGYRWLSSDSKQGGYFQIKAPAKANAVIGLEIINFSSKVKPQISGDNIKINIEVTANLGFYEEDGTGELLTPAMTKKLENAANLEIKRQIAACISRTQELESDIFGWGQDIRINQPKEWNRFYPNWSNIYPSVTSNIQVKTLISRSYLTTKSFKFQ